MLRIVLLSFFANFCGLVSGGASGVQTWVWEKPEIFPNIPIAAPNSTNPRCRNDSLQLIDGISRNYEWAIRMWDATPRAPEGILMGTHTHLGNFDGCLRVKTPVKAQYCIGLYSIHIAKDLNDTRTIYPHIRDYGLDKRKAPRDTLFMGMCVPASCSSDDMTEAINAHLSGLEKVSRLPNGTSYSIYVVNSSCDTIDRTEVVPPAEIAFWAVGAALVVIVFTCSFIATRQDDRKSVIHCFSLPKNASKLFTVKKPTEDDGFYVFHGIKALAIVIVYFTHKFLSILWVSSSHEFIEISKLNPYNTFAMLEGDLPCDTFFFLSGALVAYSFYKSMNKPIPSPFFIILNRFLRLVPSFYFSIWLHTVALDRIFMGPTWNLLYGSDKEQCKKNWWLNLLLLQNYIRPDEMCITSSWYVSCDFHYFVVAVLLVLILRRNEKLGFYLIGILLVGTTISPGLTTYFRKLDVVYMQWYSFQMTPRAIPAFSEVYVASHNRAAIYVVGMCYGIYMSKQKGKNPKVTRVGLAVGIVIALAFMCLPALLGYQFFDKPVTDDNRWIGAVFISIRRPFWGIGIGILLYVFHFYPIRAMKYAFESKFSVVMSRLTYGIYLVHLSVIIARNISRREPILPDMFVVIMESAADIVLVTLVSTVLYLFLDTPLQNLLDYTLQGKKSPTVRQTNALESRTKNSSTATLEVSEIVELPNDEIVIHCKHDEEHKL